MAASTPQPPQPSSHPSAFPLIFLSSTLLLFQPPHSPGLLLLYLFILRCIPNLLSSSFLHIALLAVPSNLFLYFTSYTFFIYYTPFFPFLMSTLHLQKCSHLLLNYLQYFLPPNRSFLLPSPLTPLYLLWTFFCSSIYSFITFLTPLLSSSVSISFLATEDPLEGPQETLHGPFTFVRID